jgi:hypothetical protein
MSSQEREEQFGGPRVRGLVARYNVLLPPASGTLRDRVLRDHGDNSLRAAKRLFGATLAEVLPLLPKQDAELPLDCPTLESAIPAHMERWDEVATALRRAAQRAGHEAPPAEASARAALRNAVDALNYLEDTARLDEAHGWVHKTGALVGGLYGCEIVLEDGVWWETCPTRLAHVRMGWSPGFTARVGCSVCGGDFSECEHMPGMSYSTVAAVDDDGTCSICLRAACGDHNAGDSYLAPATGVISEADLLEISLVPRPRDPLARITGVEMEPSLLESILGSIPQNVTRLRCRRCLEPCSGLKNP